MSILNKIHNKIYSIAIIFTYIIILSNYTYANSNELSEWRTTNANIEVEEMLTEEVNLKQTILGKLVKVTRKKLDELLENDKKTIKIFKITYHVSVLKNDKDIKQQIEQYGIVKTLPMKMQEDINNDSESSVSIQYKMHNPFIIKFASGGETFDAPELLILSVK